MGADCAPPGTPWSCGTCQVDPGDCTDDAQCSTGQTCNPIACSCQSATRCGPGCASNADCSDGQECSGGTHPRCVALHCLQASECGAGFDCLSAVCVRRSCAADADCGGAYCVTGQCHRGLGECRQPVP